jgi:hypothetical protein
MRLVEARINQNFSSYSNASAKAWIRELFELSNVDPLLTTYLGYASGSVIISYTLRGTAYATAETLATQMRAYVESSPTLVAHLDFISMAVSDATSDHEPTGYVWIVAWVVVVWICMH